MGRRKELARVYIHTSLSQPMYDRMEAVLEEGGKIPPGSMRDFIEGCVEEYFMRQDAGELTPKAGMA